MSTKDPFPHGISRETLENVVKNLEKRWGLTVVSFLPKNIQCRVEDIQREIGQFWNMTGRDFRQSRQYISFYDAEQLHCSHLTLVRSDPSGPIREKTFVRKGHGLNEMLEVLCELTSSLGPIKAALHQIVVAHDGLGIILLGECQNTESATRRRTLISGLNRVLQKAFCVSPRNWDLHPSKYSKLHCAVGYLKRSVGPCYDEFANYMTRISFSPIEFELDKVALVHHRYRSLARPQEGEISLVLGEKCSLTAVDFVRELKLEH
jgi:hypothetical protein